MKHDHYVLIRVVYVTPDWVPFNRIGGWTTVAPQKETESAKYYEVAIWEEMKAVHLYAFDESFDPSYGQGGDAEGGVARLSPVEHRESYVIGEASGMPDDRDARSAFLRDAFGRFFDVVSREHPGSGYGLMFSGHGNPGGALFAGLVSPPDVRLMLDGWTRVLGRKLDFIDMGGPCSKGSFSDLASFCPYSRYYVASDLPNGGYTFDEAPDYQARYEEVGVEQQYPFILNGQTSLREALNRRIDLQRKRYVYSRNSMVANQVEQANYLYDCEQFLEFAGPFNDFFNPRASGTGQWIDAAEFLWRTGGDSLVERFDLDVVVHRADNRDFFQWQEVANGMLKLDAVEELNLPDRKLD